MCDQSLEDEAPKKRNTAQRRWRILAKTLIGPREEAIFTEAENDVSIRRFTSFGLLKTVRLENAEKNEDFGARWYEYSGILENRKFTVQIRWLKKSFTANELIGFNNTGNVCVWPSEECLAYYLLKNREICRNRRVLELGGGMSCLAGVIAAKYCDPSSVSLTDGNANSVENVRCIVARNEMADFVECRVVRWSKAARAIRAARSAKSFPYGNPIGLRIKSWTAAAGDDDALISPEKSYDVILCADCLFFDEVRSDLVDTIYGWLANDGLALVVAPKRGETFEKFAEAATKRGFAARRIDRADYWKSQGRKFCDFCKCWIADNKPSIDFHEGGKKHKDNVSKRLKEIHKNSAKQAKQNKKMEDDIRKMENAAMAAYLKDVENNTRDMTADRIIEEKRNRIDTRDALSGNRSATIPETTPGFKRKTHQFPHEIDPCDPTLSRNSRQYQQPRVQPRPENKAQGKTKTNKGKGKGKKAQEEDRPAKPVRRLWYEARSPEGYTYYWHIETNESVWDPPEEGYLTFAEQEEEAKEQALQEKLLEQLEEEEAIANKDIIEEKRANAERERLKQLTKARSERNRLDQTAKTAETGEVEEAVKTEEDQTETQEQDQRPYRRDYSGSYEKSHPYGPWKTVRTVETKPVDLQLPRLPQKMATPLPVFENAEPPPPQRTFKEKTITRIDAGDSDGDFEPIGFKKRKIGNKNVRKRLNDD